MWSRDVPLAELTRWKIGGLAPLLGRARDEEELRELLEEVGGRRVYVLGLGANLLIADSGPGGPVLMLDGEFKRVEVRESSIVAGAAASIAAVVQASRRAARAGLWILEAVPGTIGGALRMNAGTAETGLWDLVSWADVIWPGGRMARLVKEDVRPSYREIDLDPEAIFMRAEIEAPAGGDPERIEEEHRVRRESKLRAQVYDQPTCGSTWRNPPEASAWQLIDRVGMRGARRGDAQISTKHANFIVNLGNAKARDVIDLMVETRRRVREETGIELRPEIHFWGFSEETLGEVGARP